MKLKSYAYAMAAGVMAFGAVSSQAAVLDAWQLDTTGAGLASTTTGIGHLNLSGGTATVSQQVDGSGNAFVGAKFSELGGIYSISYTPENVPGASDAGAPALFNNFLQLQIVFTGLTGVVNSFDSTTGAISYTFDPGVGTASLQGCLPIGCSTYTNLANLSLAQGAGNLNAFFSLTGSNGASVIDALILNSGYTSGLFKDSTGASLDSAVAAGTLFLSLKTNNAIASNATDTAPCSFDASINCRTVSVQSNGSADLVTVPEPGVIALMGIGLLGMGLAKRRKA